MANRKRIGIIFNFNKIWLGGAYYVQNIMKSLDYLEDSEKPEIIIFYKKELSRFVENINYPYLKIVPWKFSSIYTGYFLSWVLRKNIFVNKIIKKFDLDGIYPLYEHPIKNKDVKKTKLVAWFPDLQHKFYPKYFNKINLFLREERVKMIVRNASILVVSSEDVANNFKKLYKLPKRLKIHVLPFVSMINNFSFDNFSELKQKYNLPNNYFIVSNQFYEHKNHITVFKALSFLKDKGTDVHVVFTGKMEDYRNPIFIDKLKKEIDDNEISEMMSFLGVIPRDEQLCLMKNADAIIQPSLFEGWSTVIEDAKSLQVPVISSNIAVHKEQLKKNGIYFNPLDEEGLAEILSTFIKSDNRVYYEEYEKRVLKFAENFNSIFDNKK